MANQQQLTVADQRQATPGLRWLTLHAPELARGVRAGQYVLLRCADPGSYDPLLRRPLFVAAAEQTIGQIGLLYAPDERGLAWLARAHPGDTLDLIGPLGHPFALDRRTRNLLLIGQGAGLAALLLLARQATARGCAVTLLAGADGPQGLPPPFLLPGDVEYQSAIGPAVEILTPPVGPPVAATRTRKPKNAGASAPASPPPPPQLIPWADQICAALPDDQLGALRMAIRAAKYRWERGFASVLREGPLVCGVGACGVCAVETRKGMQMVCSDGPVFDLRDFGE